MRQSEVKNYSFIRRRNIENSLLVIQLNWYKDLLSNKKYSAKDIEVCNLDNDLGKACLEVLERNNCNYIIANYDNENVILYTKLNKLITICKQRFWVGYTYRINKPSNHLICDLDWLVSRYNWYSVMKRMTLYRLICEAEANWYILEKDLKKRYINKNAQRKVWTSLTKPQRDILRNVKRYSKRAKELRELDETTEWEDNELMMYRKRFNVYKAIEIDKIFETWNEDGINKIIWLVKTAKTYYEVINNFV